MATVPLTAPGWLPLLGHSIPLLSRRIEFTSSLRRYGDVVKVCIGPLQTYLVTEKELTNRVLVTDAGNYERGRLFDKVRPYMGDGIATSSGRQHLRQRRLMQPQFHRNEIAGYVAGMTRAAEETVDSWRPGQVRMVYDDMEALASTIIGRALFSAGMPAEALHQMLQRFAIVTRQSMFRVISPTFIGTLPLPFNRRFDHAVEYLHRVVGELVAEHRAQEHDHGDLLSMLLAARYEDTGKGMTDEEVYEEILALFVAGGETTSSAISWFFHEVGGRPDIESRVLAELDELLGDEPVSVETLPRLTYTRQVINEVLRRYSMWLLMRRPLTDVELGGVRVPAGTEVIVSPHALHHDPRNFPDPGRFDPNRWSPENIDSVPRNAYIPFASGVHQCIGNVFALTEITVVAATVLRRVRLTPVPGRPLRPKVTNFHVPTRLSMKVVPRNRG